MSAHLRSLLALALALALCACEDAALRDSRPGRGAATPTLSASLAPTPAPSLSPAPTRAPSLAPTRSPAPSHSPAPSASPDIPSPERCGNGLDDDRDGRVDQGCICGPAGATQPCWSGPRAARNLGACHEGEQRCEAGGEFALWGACTGERHPEPERCGDLADNNCDGRTDEGCTCLPGDQNACYTGRDPATEGVGICAPGLRTCLRGDGDDVFWSLCEGAVLPQPEQCGDGLDNDCDGEVDDTCPCLLGEVLPCYPDFIDILTAGRGNCRLGTQRCVRAADSVALTACEGAVVPRREVCFDGQDNDCDGVADEDCECEVGQTRECYDGPPETRAVGTCRGGRQVCTPTEDGGQVWSHCQGDVTPLRDACGDALDTDCDGAVDEGCVCVFGDVHPCYTGPGGTLNVGACRAGVETCRANGEEVFWSACENQVLPQREICDDGVDSDCDGREESCPVIDMNVSVAGDCLTVCCPDHHPFPVGCNLNFQGGDARGCVAYNPPAQCVYLQEGDVCGAGRVSGTLRCSNTPGGNLNASSCPINKSTRYYRTHSSQCP